jgi:phosphodiesterase/alkaline phosphatase D-like protein
LSWTDNSLKETQFTIQRATDANFTAGLTTFNYVNPSTVAPNAVTFQDTNARRDTSYWYRVFAIGNPVGDLLTAGFPTMAADSVSTNALQVSVGAPTTQGPANPTNLVATVQAGPQVRLTWRDNATNETGFVVERCTGVGCTNFAQTALPGPRNGTGNVNYTDTTVTAGNTYSYQVWAVNAIGRSAAPTNLAAAAIPAIPAAPTSFTVQALKNPTGNRYTATLIWGYTTEPPNPAPTSFTIERATNATFTRGRNTSTASGAARGDTQTLNPNTTYYYRIRANSNISGSSAWKNALPFPIRTGP